MWGRQSYRWSDLDFEANLREGLAVDWPIRYQDIAPWYSYAEKFAGISGEKLGLAQLPDGEFLPPMEMFYLEKEVKARIEKNSPGRRMTIGRVANLSQPTQAQLDGRPLTLPVPPPLRLWLPVWRLFQFPIRHPARRRKTGLLTLRPDSVVTEIVYDDSQQRATGVPGARRRHMQDREYYSRLVFVCASTVASTVVLLNSVSDRFPHGLGNDSGELGHNLMDHHFRVGASGVWEGGLDRYYYGRRANGIYVRDIGNVDADRRDYVRGLVIRVGPAAKAGSGNVSELAFGADFKKRAHPSR